MSLPTTAIPIKKCLLLRSQPTPSMRHKVAVVGGEIYGVAHVVKAGNVFRCILCPVLCKQMLGAVQKSSHSRFSAMGFC